MPTLDTIAVGTAIEPRAHAPSMVSLFLYNAVIWNPHRIHFDETYTTQVEKHPGIVIDGPLQGDWLSQVVTHWLGDDGELVELEYSNRRACYLGETLQAGGEVVEVDRDARTVTLEIFIKNEQDEVIAPGRAKVRLSA
jgi:hydroxyacyl-ACP dehydratase HTD2-like protein with hotdog domain